MSNQDLKFTIGRRPFMTRALALLSSAPLLALSRGEAQAQQSSRMSAGAFDFGIIGDMPYTRKQEAEYGRVLDDINTRELAFVAHVGDMMSDPRPYERNPDSARTPCTDENYAYVLGTLQSCKHPVVITPGDNDWADVVAFKKQKMDPLERLEKVRDTFFPKGKSLGQRTMAVESQADDPAHAKFRENLAWSINGVTFATLHVIGSSDNARDADEHGPRLAANVAWVKRAFAAARANNSAGIVLISHANPGFENRWTRSYANRYARSVRGAKAPKEAAASPYDPFLDALIAEMQTYNKPVIYIHGDTHIFRIGKPLMNPKTKRFFENFTRVETFGWPDSNWVKIGVNPANPHLFEVSPEVVSGNSANYPA